MVRIAIIDFKSSFSPLVEQVVEKTGAKYEVFDPATGAEELKDYDGFIFTGSPETVYDGGRQADPKLFDLKKPILGVCYGHQLIHYMLGGKVERSKTPEEGNFIFRGGGSLLLKGLPEAHQVHMSHFDEVTKMAEGFENLGSTRKCQIAATVDRERKLYTVQFHPESYGNDFGFEIYRNFTEIVEDEKNN